jgi:hypothetical protein
METKDYVEGPDDGHCSTFSLCGLLVEREAETSVCECLSFAVPCRSLNAIKAKSRNTCRLTENIPVAFNPFTALLSLCF